MKRLNFRAIISAVLAVVIAFGSFSLCAAAAETAKVVKPPKETDFYEGIDWYINKNGAVVVSHDLNLDGIVLSYNSKEYPVRDIPGFGPNVSASSLDGKWKVGENKIKVYNYDIPESGAYAVTTVNFVRAKSIELVNRPDKTILVQDQDWQLGILNDVEIKEFDTTGTILSVTFTNGVTKTVYDNNSYMSWSVPPEIEIFEIGPQDLYITYGELYVPFGAFFATSKVHCPGDVNTDNKINSLDALQILKASVGSISFNAEQKQLSDVNSDGSTNSMDALKVLQYAVGKINFIYK